jgi:hypothetical protein
MVALHKLRPERLTRGLALRVGHPHNNVRA